MLSTKSDTSAQKQLLSVSTEHNKAKFSLFGVTETSEMIQLEETQRTQGEMEPNGNASLKLTGLDSNPLQKESDIDNDDAGEVEDFTDECYSDLTDGIYIKPGVYISTNFGSCNPPSEPVTPDLSNTDVSRFDVLKDPMLETPTEEAERPNGKQESSGKSKVNKNLTDEEQKRNKVDRSVVFMLLAVCCTYLVFTGSAGALNILGHISVAPELGKEGQKFLRAATEVPCIMNNSLNFIFYLFCGQSFRKTFQHKYLAFLRRRN